MIWIIQIENNARRKNKLEDNVNKSYTVIILEFCPHKMKTTIRGHPKYDSIINNPLKLMGEKFQ